MKKNILILIVMMVMLASSVFGAYCDDWVEAEVCQDQEAGNVDDWTNALVNDTIPMGESYNMEVLTHASGVYLDTDWDAQAINFNITFKTNFTRVVDDYFRISFGNGDDYNGFLLYGGTTVANCVPDELCTNDDGVGYDTTGVDFDLIHNITIEVYDNGGAEFNGYYNGNNVLFTGLTEKDALTLGQIVGVNFYSNGESQQFNIDDFLVWNRTSQVGGGSAGDTLNISTILPATGESFNTLPINISFYAASSTIFNASVYINDTLNKTLLNIPAGSSVFVNFSINGLEEEYYNYSIRAYNNDTGENTSASTLYFDVSTPTVTTAFVDGITLFGNENITYQFNFSDNFMIFSYNATLDGTTLDGRFNLNTTSTNYNFSRNPADLDVGLHNLTIRVADGHTALEIAEYDWKNGIFNDYLRYNFANSYVKIEGKDKSLFDSWGTTKEKDRYTFKFEPSNPSPVQQFIIESDESISVVKKAGYYAGQWLIIGDQWMDFVNENEPSSIVSIEKINDHKVEVTISGLKNPELQSYSSIGDLNIVTQQYLFYSTKATVTYTNPVTETQLQTIYFDINKTATTTSTTANLVWNNTLKPLTLTEFAGYYRYNSTFITPGSQLSIRSINFTFNFTLNTTTANYTDNVTNEQTISIIGIDNCSTYTQRALNITVRRDDTNALTPTNIGSYMQVWQEDIDNFKAFNLTWTNQQNVSVCIFPNSSSYNIYSQIEFGGTDTWATETHYLTNFTLTNQTQLVDLYLTPNSTAVTFSVTDENDNVVPDVYINVLRYDFDTNSHITTEIIETDELGEAIGNIVLTTQWYKFILVRDGVVVLTTDPVKITGTSRNFRINLQTNFFDFYDVFDSIQSSLTFTNSTLNYAYTFVNTEGSSVTACLNVIERSAITDVLINNSCITASSGTILVNVGSDVDGKTFIGTGTIQVNPTDLNQILEKHFKGSFKKYGQDGILISVLVRITLALIGLWNPVVALILLVLADVGMVSMGLYGMSWTVLIFYLVLAGITMYKVGRK